jgi:GINS complex subunit 2
MMLNGVSAEENEYLAKEELVTIVSGLGIPDRFEFISGIFGPLEPGVSCDVPIWLALHIRKRSRCKIKIPHWLQVDQLKEVLEEEKTSQGVFQPMPFHYIEIAQMLLTNAWEDFINPDEVKTLVRDVENIRMDRLRVGALDVARTIQRDSEMSPMINLANISALEILAIRGFLMESLKAFKELTQPVNTGSGGGYGAGSSSGGGDGGFVPAAATAERAASNRFLQRNRNREE